MNTFITHGYQICEKIFDEDQCKLLLNNISHQILYCWLVRSIMTMPNLYKEKQNPLQ